MKIKFVGEDCISFRNGNVYDAKKIHDELGDGYAIFDEDEEWYRFGTKFVNKNFVVVEEENVKTA